MTNLNSMHKIWRAGTITLLLLLAVHTTLDGFFREKTMLTDKSPPRGSSPENSQRKVILLLADALREDFVEFPENVDTYLKPDDPMAYKGKKLGLFRRLKESLPEKTILFPLQSEMPTVTSVRIKGMLTGGLSTLFEFTDEFTSSEVNEDSVLFQVRQCPADEKRVVFYGDHIWEDMFDKYFDKKAYFNSLNTRDLDSLDNGVSKQIYQELDQGSHFKLMLGHIIGVDSAGHTYDAQNAEIERKLQDTQEIIHEIIAKMDDKTTLVVFGDHGMTPDGNHGGQSELEMRTVIFAHQKTPFAMAEKYADMKNLFAKIDKGIKQVDLAPIVSQLLDLPLPYSNLGIGHPAFALTDSLGEIHANMVTNLDQMKTYLEAYCGKTRQAWCENEIADFDDKIQDFKRYTGYSDSATLQSLEEINIFANEKYQHFKQIWTEYDNFAFFTGICTALWLFFFHQFTSLDRSSEQQDVSGVTGLAICFIIYLGSVLGGFYPKWVVCLVVFIVSWGQTRKQRRGWAQWAYTKGSRQNLKPKTLVYPMLVGGLMLAYGVQQVTDSLIQEGDYVTDNLVLATVACLWVTQPAHLRRRDLWPILGIVFGVKVSYFVDNERSFNFDVEQSLFDLRQYVRNEPLLVQALPLIFTIFLENRLARHYSFGKLHKLQAHGLTAMLFFNYVVTYVQQPQMELKQTLKSIAAENEHMETMALLGNTIYMTIVVSIFSSTAYYRFVRGKSWDNISVRNGCFLIKGAMLVTGRTGPLLYFCLLLQLYCFAVMVNYRRDSHPGKTLPLQIFFAVFSMNQYFMRGNHRERISSINYGKVCPGGVFCGEAMHWTLIIFEIFASYFVILSLLPLIVKARVQYAYAHLREEETEMEPIPAKTSSKSGSKVRDGPREKSESGKALDLKGQKQPKNQWSSAHAPVQFVGNMAHGIAIVQMMSILVLFLSAILVQFTKEEVIFPQRTAPKFLFDALRAFIILPFAIFWQ